MAITTTAEFYSALTQRVRIRKAALASQGTVQSSLWAAGGDPPAGTLAVGNTTTGVLFDSNTTGAPAITAFPSGNTGYLKFARMYQAITGSIWVYDRLWGAGAISLTSLATTTFSGQPSYAARLPAGSNYEVEVLIEVVIVTPPTATTISGTYTNEAGTPGRAFQTLSATSLTANRVGILSLQDGDKGVQSVDSITVGGTVATQGTFNVIVGRRLAALHSEVEMLSDNQNWDLLGMPQVFDTACLWVTPFCAVNAGTACALNLEIING